MPCSIPPPILKYQHFASNGPYAPRACKPKSIATYYKTALQILHTSQNLLLGILPSCQLAEQRLGLSKEICKRISGYAHPRMKGDGGCGWLELESGNLSWKHSLGRKQDKLPLLMSTCFQVRTPPLQRGKAPKSTGVVSAGLAREGNGNMDLKPHPHPAQALGGARLFSRTGWLQGL